MRKLEENMTKAELIKKFQEAEGLTNARAEKYFNTLCGIMAVELNKDLGSVPLQGIGKIVTKERAARTGRNPRTGQPVTIPACRVLSIRVSKEYGQKLRV